jgi:hypothetical protein
MVVSRYIKHKTAVGNEIKDNKKILQLKQLIAAEPSLTFCRHLRFVVTTTMDQNQGKIVGLVDVATQVAGP